MSDVAEGEASLHAMSFGHFECNAVIGFHVDDVVFAEMELHILERNFAPLAVSARFCLWTKC